MLVRGAGLVSEVGGRSTIFGQIWDSCCEFWREDPRPSFHYIPLYLHKRLTRCQIHISAEFYPILQSLAASCSSSVWVATTSWHSLFIVFWGGVKFFFLISGGLKASLTEFSHKSSGIWLSFEGSQGKKPGWPGEIWQARPGLWKSF